MHKTRAQTIPGSVSHEQFIVPKQSFVIVLIKQKTLFLHSFRKKRNYFQVKLYKMELNTQICFVFILF